MSFCNQIIKRINQLKIENKELILENLTDIQIEELNECAYNVKKISDNKYLILEN